MVPQKLKVLIKTISTKVQLEFSFVCRLIVGLESVCLSNSINCTIGAPMTTSCKAPRKSLLAVKSHDLV